MPTISRSLLVATLVASPFVFESQAATRSTTFAVTAVVAPECAITVDEDARVVAAQSWNANSAVATRCSIEAPYRAARSVPSEAPFASTETAIPDSESTHRVVRITITF